jgi:hypothetical protein
MTIRAVIVYAVLFVAALIGAYASWTHEPEAEKAEGVVLVDAEPAEIARIAYESEGIDVTLEPREDELGEYLWVSTTRRRTRPPANPHAAPSEPPSEEEPQIEKSAFKAGKTGDKLLEDLAPFRVARALDVSKEKLSDFGFDEPEGKLVVETKKGAKTTFQIGTTAYGFKNVYLKDVDSGQVYVVKRSVVSPLERADSRLPEKELFGAERADIERVTISTADASQEFVQHNRDDANAATWTKPSSEEANPTAESWLDKVFRLRASKYVPKSEEPKGLESVFAVKVVPEDGEPVTVEVLRGPAAEDGEMKWYARSGYSRGLVELNSNLASDTADDLGTLFEVEGAEAE